MRSRPATSTPTPKCARRHGIARARQAPGALPATGGRQPQAAAPARSAPTACRPSARPRCAMAQAASSSRAAAEAELHEQGASGDQQRELEPAEHAGKVAALPGEHRADRHRDQQRHHERHEGRVEVGRRRPRSSARPPPRAAGDRGCRAGPWRRRSRAAGCSAARPPSREIGANRPRPCSAGARQA